MYNFKHLFNDEEISQGIVLVSFGHFLQFTAVIAFSEEKLFIFYKFYDTQP